MWLLAALRLMGCQPTQRAVAQPESEFENSVRQAHSAKCESCKVWNALMDCKLELQARTLEHTILNLHETTLLRYGEAFARAQTQLSSSQACVVSYKKQGLTSSMSPTLFDSLGHSSQD